MSKKTVLVTGGAGYIGSHTVLALLDAGYQVIVLDNLINGHRAVVEQVLKVPFIEGDICNRDLLDRVFTEYSIDAVFHFAAYAYVGESVADPAKYYRNNVGGSLTLLEAMVAADVLTFVFSSTCATYGMPKRVPIDELHPQVPMNPYGMSKLMVEHILSDFDQAYNLRSVWLRYFNAAGADPDGYLGENHTPETHLIPLALLTALGQRSQISIFGTDYPTPDGTCIRDYIHVSDLADAHLLGLEHLLKGGETTAFNLGNGDGFSVQEVLNTVKDVTGQNLLVVHSERRLGDPPILVSASDKAHRMLNWEPKYSNLHTIISHAWEWLRNSLFLESLKDS